jgi:hypothetical protein
MSRVIKIVGFALACTFVVASVALAALPRPGREYKGTAVPEDGGKLGEYKVKLVAETGHKLSAVRVEDDCGIVTKWRNVNVNDEGKFRATKSNDFYGENYFKITGKFVSRGRATGKVDGLACDSPKVSTFEATIQPE